MPLALPSSAPSLGAVAGHSRRNAPVHAARQVANDDSKTHDALVQQAVTALQNCASSIQREEGRGVGGAPCAPMVGREYAPAPYEPKS